MCYEEKQLHRSFLEILLVSYQIQKGGSTIVFAADLGRKPCHPLLEYKMIGSLVRRCHQAISQLLINFQVAPYLAGDCLLLTICLHGSLEALDFYILYPFGYKAVDYKISYQKLRKYSLLQGN